MSQEHPQVRRIAVLTPVLNDWTCARQLVQELGQVDRPSAAGPAVAVDLVMVDDGSTAPCPEDIAAQAPACIRTARVVRLERNVGHQRAICIGLCYISENVPCDLLIVMDCDGEDCPGDIPALIAAAERQALTRIVFAARVRRSEGLTFRLGYRSYRLLHRVLTGIPVRFGNFSAVPAEMLHRLPLVPEMWNHYAAAVLKARLPYTAVPICRGTRYAGESSMNVISLTMHGVSAMSVFAEVISVRLMLLAQAAGLLLVGCTVGSLWLHGYDLIWILLAAVAVLALGMPILVMLGIFMLAIHAFRGTASFLPKRDYRLFVRAVASLRLTPAPALAPTPAPEHPVQSAAVAHAPAVENPT